MGWYHDASFNWEDHEGSAPACSINNRPPAQSEQAEASPPAESIPEESSPAEPAPTEPPAKPEASGTTACPLPADSPPPPPPPDVDSIYHLCQTTKWEEAKQARQPYFPPTFVNDGKFTRATVYKADLVTTANQYYKDTPGDWIVLEINCQTLFALGIPILSQDAPESTSESNPVKCLQVFGGISTTLPGLITNVYKMKRSSTGTFFAISDRPISKKERGQEEEKKESSEPPRKNGTKNAKVSPKPTEKKRGFWPKFRG